VAYRIAVDADACISSGTCVANAPQLFRFDDDEIAELVPGAPAAPDAVVLDAARGCPSGAIRVFDGADEIDVH
jgi:ferredoxin